jgi:hypothetical protein
MQPHRRPDTILKAEPEAVLGLVAGVITADEVLSQASFHGDPHILATVAGTAQK